MEVIYGPTVPAVRGVIYQVTLASGVIVTSPEGFADGQHLWGERRVVVAENGTVLRPEDLRPSLAEDVSPAPR